KRGGRDVGLSNRNADVGRKPGSVPGIGYRTVVECGGYFCCGVCGSSGVECCGVGGVIIAFAVGLVRFGGPGASGTPLTVWRWSGRVLCAWPLCASSSAVGVGSGHGGYCG